MEAVCQPALAGPFVAASTDWQVTVAALSSADGCSLYQASALTEGTR